MKREKMEAAKVARKSGERALTLILLFLSLCCPLPDPGVHAHFVARNSNLHARQFHGVKVAVEEVHLGDEEVGNLKDVTENANERKRENDIDGKWDPWRLSEKKLAVIQLPSVVKINLRAQAEEELYSNFGIYLLIMFVGLVIIASFILAFYIIRVVFILISGGCQVSQIMEPPPDLTPLPAHFLTDSSPTQRTFGLISVPLDYANYANS